MKHRILFVVITAMLGLFSGVALSAQTRELDFSNLAEFNGIDVSDSFEVTVNPSNFYGAKVVVDDVLSGYGFETDREFLHLNAVVLNQSRFHYRERGHAPVGMDGWEYGGIVSDTQFMQNFKQCAPYS